MAVVLVVDDEVGIAHLLSDVLSDEGHRVILAANGHEGLKRAEEERPDLVITDFMMPVMDGAQLIKALRDHRDLKRVPIYLMSSAPEAAIYLAIKVDLTGKKTRDGVLKDQADVTSYLLNEAGLAVVPFSAFGAPKTSPWYRLSVGTCRLEDIPEMFRKLREAMKKLS